MNQFYFIEIQHVSHCSTIRKCKYQNLPVFLLKSSLKCFLEYTCMHILVGAEAPILWPPDGISQLIGKEPDAGWERLRAGGEGDDRVWDDWMASLTQETWIWGNSRRQWRTGKPGVLQPMVSSRIGPDLASRQQNKPKAYWQDLHFKFRYLYYLKSH